jgi:hypothetical protein
MRWRSARRLTPVLYLMCASAELDQLNEAESAELFRLGLIAGYYTIADVVRWADSRIESDRDSRALELTLAGRKSVADVIAMLNEVAADADTAARTRDVAGLIRNGLYAGRIEARNAHKMIARLAWASEDEMLNYIVNTWQDLPYIRGFGGEPGPPVTAHEMLEDMEDYEPCRGALRNEV